MNSFLSLNERQSRLCSKFYHSLKLIQESFLVFSTLVFHVPLLFSIRLFRCLMISSSLILFPLMPFLLQAWKHLFCKEKKNLRNTMAHYHFFPCLFIQDSSSHMFKRLEEEDQERVVWLYHHHLSWFITLHIKAWQKGEKSTKRFFAWISAFCWNNWGSKWKSRRRAYKVALNSTVSFGEDDDDFDWWVKTVIISEELLLQLKIPLLLLVVLFLLKEHILL